MKGHPEKALIAVHWNYSSSYQALHFCCRIGFNLRRWGQGTRTRVEAVLRSKLSPLQFARADSLGGTTRSAGCGWARFCPVCRISGVRELCAQRLCAPQGAGAQLHRATHAGPDAAGSSAFDCGGNCDRAGRAEDYSSSALPRGAARCRFGRG